MGVVEGIADSGGFELVLRGGGPVDRLVLVTVMVIGKIRSVVIYI